MKRKPKTRGRGRPREGRKINVATSFKQAATLTGLSVPTLRNCRDAGCGAFRHGRLYLDELTTWLDRHPEALEASESDPATKEAARLRRINAEIEKTEIWIANAKRTLVTRQWHEQQIREMFSQLRGELEAFPGRVTPRVVGLSPAKIQAVLKEEIAGIVRRMAGVEPRP